MRGRVLFGVAALLCLVALAAFVPMPGLERIRGWSAELGPWFPLVFFAAYAVVTVFPIPRSTFTYSAAVLFSPAVSIPGSLLATACAAALAFAGVRRLGHRNAAVLRDHRRIAGMDRRLRHRGWLPVLSLRLVPVVPFSVLNYAAALSSIRFRHFLPASVLGSLPGTVAAILLGNSLTEGSGAGALWATAVFAVVGLLGLALDARLPVSESRDTPGAPITGSR